jgi:hypothetical protein
MLRRYDLAALEWFGFFTGDRDLLERLIVTLTRASADEELRPLTESVLARIERLVPGLAVGAQSAREIGRLVDGPAGVPRTVCSRDLMHATYAATVQLKNGASDVLVRGDAFRLVPSPVEAAAIAVRYRLGALRFPPFPLWSLGSGPARLEPGALMAQLLESKPMHYLMAAGSRHATTFRFTTCRTGLRPVATGRSYEEPRGVHYDPRPKRLTLCGGFGRLSAYGT